MSENPQLDAALDEWVKANNAAVDAALKCYTKKGNFNPPLGKPWPEYEALKIIANEKWYAMRKLVNKPQLG